MLDVVPYPRTVVVHHSVDSVLVSSSAAVSETRNPLNGVRRIPSSGVRPAHQASATVTGAGIGCSVRQSGAKHIAGQEKLTVRFLARLIVDHWNL